MKYMTARAIILFVLGLFALALSVLIFVPWLSIALFVSGTIMVVVAWQLLWRNL